MCGTCSEQPGLPNTVSMLLHNLQRIAHHLQQPRQLKQQKLHPRRRNAPPKEAAAAALPGHCEGSQRRGAALVFASTSPSAAALAAQPSRAGGSQPRPAEPSSGRPEAAAAARASESDWVSTASTARAPEPPGQDGDRAQAAGQAARGSQASPGAAQRQRSGAAGGEAQPRLQRHWRWPREWALPHWPPPQLSGFVLPAWAAQAVGGKQKLLTVQQFFNYVENEGAPFIKCYSSSAQQFRSAGVCLDMHDACMAKQFVGTSSSPPACAMPPSSDACSGMLCSGMLLCTHKLFCMLSSRHMQAAASSTRWTVTATARLAWTTCGRPCARGSCLRSTRTSSWRVRGVGVGGCSASGADLGWGEGHSALVVCMPACVCCDA